MIQERIRKIEEIILTSTLISEENREELLNQLRSLRSEVNGISDKNSGDLHMNEDIRGYTPVVNEQREISDDNQLSGQVEGLTESVRKFEASHPDLVKKVNEICVLLANSGI